MVVAHGGYPRHVSERSSHRPQRVNHMGRWVHYAQVPRKISLAEDAAKLNRNGDDPAPKRMRSRETFDHVDPDN
jgi:hypothetical protein